MAPSAQLEEELNRYGARGEPILFMIDYEGGAYEIHPLDALPEGIEFSFAPPSPPALPLTPAYSFEPVPRARYDAAFARVQTYIRAGHTYLLNLTFPSRISLDLSFAELYDLVDAPFRLRYHERFICFSPERFVTIEEDRIYTYPMKGTIDATIADAPRRLLADPKERAEHVMVVDLLRNDLGRVASQVRVERFRYLEKIRAGTRQLWQTSSKIAADLGHGWQRRLGTIMSELLPAGSITGTPKRRTCEIIQEVEGYRRGYFTGIFGYFDGKRLESAVMIRFIEEIEGVRYYKSGGGITIDSDPDAEYRELCEKIYVPFL